MQGRDDHEYADDEGRPPHRQLFINIHGSNRLDQQNRQGKKPTFVEYYTLDIKKEEPPREMHQ